MPPYDVSFYLSYIQIEKCAADSDENRIIACYEDSLKHFGRENIDLWLSYIEFKNSKQSMQLDVAEVYWRAMKNLKTELIESFTQKFSFFQINLGSTALKRSPSSEDIEMNE